MLIFKMFKGGQPGAGDELLKFLYWWGYLYQLIQADKADSSTCYLLDSMPHQCLENKARFDVFVK